MIFVVVLFFVLALSFVVQAFVPPVGWAFQASLYVVHLVFFSGALTVSFPVMLGMAFFAGFIWDALTIVTVPEVAGAMPQVSYYTPAPEPAATRSGIVLDPLDSLGPDEMRRLIRRLESLDGEERIVCVPTRESTFGDCVFPERDDTIAP